MNQDKFSSLSLPKDMIANLDTLGFKGMTAIQRDSLPHILAKSDVIAQAKTGSGKTAAFGLGLLMSLDVKKFRVGALVLCPTRELAEQVSKEIRRLARHIHNVKILTVCGGTPLGPQARSLEHGAHIIVGTPGRILDHLDKQTLSFKHVKTLVLDEADRMLDMGFSQDIKKIVAKTPRERQTLLFSATYPETIEEMSRTIQFNPITIKVETTHKKNQIRQVFVEIGKMNKSDALIKILGNYNIKSSVIFCRTKIQCNELAKKLFDAGFFVEAIHGDLEQYEREEVLTLFSNGTLSLLIATDVAARGLDIKSLQSVINYDLTRDPEIHVHRIGRTGRANEDGLAISLIEDKDSRRVEEISKYMKETVETVAIDTLTDLIDTPTPKMSTIRISAGKKNKMRPGDILGALTKGTTITGDSVGNINIFPYHTYVAVERSIVKKAVQQLNSNPIKGREFRSVIIR